MGSSGKLGLATAAVTAALVTGQARSEPSLEVLYYWTSGSGSLAINVFADALNNAGGA